MKDDVDRRVIKFRGCIWLFVQACAVARSRMLVSEKVEGRSACRMNSGGQVFVLGGMEPAPADTAFLALIMSRRVIIAEPSGNYWKYMILRVS